MMSIQDKAKEELETAGWPEDEKAAMLKILDTFFDTWDSGGAVSVAAPVLQRLIAGKPLSPLTGADDEWWQPDDSQPDLLQNRRCFTVFRTVRDGRVEAYDIDKPGMPPITFPYWPDRAEVASPVIQVTTTE